MYIKIILYLIYYTIILYIVKTIFSILFNQFLLFNRLLLNTLLHNYLDILQSSFDLHQLQLSKQSF
jgi:hypothetical protein